MAKRLDAQMREFLEGERGEWPRIAEAADVSYSWLTKFAIGQIPRPGYAALVRLQEVQRQRKRIKPRKAKPTPAPAEAKEAARG